MGFRFLDVGIKKRRNGERMVPSRRIRHLGVVLMVVHVFGWMVWLCSMFCTGLFWVVGIMISLLLRGYVE
jgi:hypothetical protein